ncbi:MAG: hypothetical protein R3191_06280 [Anaerolineales bacterium]|nr:hypothetical protein [Anaerolineales bacterium]
MNTDQEQEARPDRDLPVPPVVGCLGAIALGIAGALVVFFALKLAVEGEVRLGGDQLTHRRVWLVTGADNAGLAYESNRIVRGSRAEGEACVRTDVNFFFWRSDETARPVEYCECYVQQGQSWENTGPCDSAEPEGEG